MITATREHEIAIGHRVYQHESKCAKIHGHNLLISFTLAGEQDNLGRVLDFSVIKTLLCMWLETEWDHRTLLYEKDPWYKMMVKIDPSIIAVPFNPTSENIAKYLVQVIGPQQLVGTGAILVGCRVWETRKCSADFLLDEVEVYRKEVL